MATNGVRALLQAQHIDYVDKRSQCNWLNILIMWTKEVNVTGNGGIISGRSETETFSRAIPWHVCKWFRKLLVREVAVFCLIPHGIQQAPNVHPICLVSRLAVLFATLEERRIIITSEQYVGVQ